MVSAEDASSCERWRTLPTKHPLHILGAKGAPVHICAPMVRYSKLAFRNLVTGYGVDIAYTPMMLAREFINHPRASFFDFSTNTRDGCCVVAQFAANDPETFAEAARLIQPYVGGVGLNCGCPQSWAIGEGLGCHLLQEPELVAAMVKAAKAACGPDFSVDVKIRIDRDISKTIAFCREVERAGVDYITVHGRLKNQSSRTKPDLEAIRVVKEACTVPVFANGDVFTLDDVRRVVNATGVDGVMSARGLQENPALFAGYEKTPWGAVEQFMNLAIVTALPCGLLTKHLMDMLPHDLTRKDRIQLSGMDHVVQVIDFMDANFDLLRPNEPGYAERVEVPRKRLVNIV